MTLGDWYYKSQVLTGSYVELDFNIRISKMKLKGDVTFSWDGTNDAGVQVAADGFQDYLGIAKGKIWVKGTGTAVIIGWE